MKFGPFAGLCAVIASAASVAAAQPAPNWNGAYAYSEPAGRDAGGAGPAAFVEHRLIVGANGCRLTAKGYQTDSEIRCKATPSAGRLDVSFLSFGDGKVENKYGVKLYSVGQPLFSIARKGAALTTTWQGYSKALVAPRPAGAYFKKAS